MRRKLQYPSVSKVLTVVAIAATGGAMVFSPFSQPQFSTSYPAHLQPQPAFNIAVPSAAAATPTSLVFSTWETPRFAQVPQGDQTTANFEVQPAPQVIPVFSKFEPPRFSTSYPAHLQPQPANELTYLGPASTPPWFVFSPFEQPKFSTAVPVHVQPQVSYQVGYSGPASTPPWFTFSKFEPPKFSTAYLFDEQTSPLFEITPPPTPAPAPLVFSTFSQPAPVASFPAFLQQNDTRYQVGFFPIAATPGALVFPPFEQPQFGPVAQGIHTIPVFEVLPPATVAAPSTLVFSPFEQPRFSTTFPFVEQPSPLFEIEPPSAFNPATPSSLVFSKFEPPRFQGYPANEQPSPLFEVLKPPPVPVSIFAEFVPPKFSTSVPAHLQPQVAYQIGLVAVQAQVPPWFVFTKWEPPKFSTAYTFVEQPSPLFEVLRPGGATPTSLVFSVFSQPPPYSRHPSHLHTQEDRNLTPFPIAKTPTSLVFTRWEPPKFSTSFLFNEQPSPIFEVLPGPAPTTGPLVFSPFEQPKFPVGYSFAQQPLSVFVPFPAAPTPGPLVFSEFIPPKFSTSYQFNEQPSPLFEVLRPSGATPGALTFSDFGIPILTTYTFANEQWNITFELSPPPATPPGGGTSRKLPDGGEKRKPRSGLEPVKKRFETPVIETKPLPIPPAREIAKKREDRPPARIVDPKRMPSDLSKLELDAMSALLDAQELSDAQDIADILAFLDGPQPDET